DEEQNDGRGDHPEAEGRTGHANVLLGGCGVPGGFSGRQAKLRVSRQGLKRTTRNNSLDKQGNTRRKSGAARYGRRFARGTGVAGAGRARRYARLFEASARPAALLSSYA